MRRLARLIGWAALATQLAPLGGCINAINGDIQEPGPGEQDPAAPPGPGGSGNDPLPNVMPLPERPNTPGEGVKPPGSAVRCEREVVATRTLRRLTNVELENTLRAAFGLDEAAWAGPSFVPDPASSDGFTNNIDRLSVGDEYAKRLLEAGKDIADVVTSPAQLGRVLPCASTGGDTCAATYLDTIGARLYRRPMTPAERERYLALWRKVKTQGSDFKTWVYWATVGLIKSPNTVYRSELGEGSGSTFTLSPYEIASALSYAYTGGPPTPELLQLAAAGRLKTADDTEAAARALVYTNGQLRPAFRQQLLRFADQWLGLSPLANITKDKTVYPDFTPDVQDALGEEVRRFFASVFIDDKGKPGDLFTAPYTFVNNTLAQFYGLAPVAGTDFVRVPRPARTGVGLMTQGAVLSIAASNKTSSPTKRGHLVRERFLCTVVPPPPKAVEPLPEPTPAETTRQRYEQIHVAAAECKGCHQLMDPIGFGLEHLDGTGRYREREGNFDIDDSGSIMATSAGDLTFKGPEELGRQLAKLSEVSDCLADYATAYTFGLNHGPAGCMARTAGDELREGKIGFVDFLIRMARSESFRTRLP
jgi:hypothetical protein